MVFYYERSQLPCPSGLPANLWSLQAIDALKKTGRPSSLYQGSFTSSGPPQTGLVKTLGMSRRGVRGSFVPPVRGQMEVPVVVQLLLLTHKVALTMAMKSQHENGEYLAIRMGHSMVIS